MLNIAIIGASTIGSLYGAAFHEAGHSVEFYVREESIHKYPPLLTYKIIDERKCIEDCYQYDKSIFTDIKKLDDFDLILVSTRHYQIQQVLDLLSKTKNPRILIFCNVWSKLSDLSRNINPDRLFFGMPRGGGTIHQPSNVLEGGLFKEVILGKSTDPFYKNLLNLFQHSQFRVTEIDDMQSWYWTHLTTTIAWITGSAKAQGFSNFTRSYRLLKSSILVGRESINIAKARGANISVCRDADVFKLKPFIAAAILYIVMRKPIIQVISKGHATPEDLKRICHDILLAGEEYGVEIELFKSYMPYVNNIK